ncbi:Stf0 family sulfotransferase [Bradyrhizobium sp.]|uniref:Stf0 family sulfotransferase n=1 Tax=Bradyrhizobium sp. TaxID=376 RepID=UPI00273596FE|nr:Stf0 family sulfotransferase [Bradyrhizobium sp.]MDP3078183.1 Stf0 family sulfotransferase [Bradyrhizobium sp.]
MTQPKRGYAICTTPRSGSNYLCELLDSTGTLGNPIEYFSPAALRVRGLPEFSGDREARLRQALCLGATSNGIYGLKLFVDHFDDMARTHWISKLPALSFVYLTREDVLGQAISAARADQTRRYRSTQPAAGPSVYDARAIRANLNYLVTADARWRAFFARNGLAPLLLTYERVADDPLSAITAIAARLDPDGKIEIDRTKVSLKIQRDAETLAWRERFVREHGDPGYLDRPRPPSPFWTPLRSAIKGVVMGRCGKR